MKILGLSSDFHDSSAALVVDGRLVAASAEERFTRNKHDSHFPALAIRHCLGEGGLAARDLDLVVFYERPFRKWVRVLESSVADWPRSPGEFVESQSEWLGKKLWTRALLSQRLELGIERIREVDHHFSHLVQSFVGSPFESASVLTVDAVGERSTASMGEARWRGGRLEIESLAHAEYPHSLGLFYSAMTAFLGFRPMNDECTVMALAAFGKPVYAPQLRKALREREDGFWEIHPEYLQFDRFLHAPWTDSFTALLGKPRDPSEPLGFSSFRAHGPSATEAHWANIAASAQLVLEEGLLHSVRALLRKTGNRNLCLAGGVALNCVANSRLLRESGIAALHVPVEPGDGGASIGAAFAGYYDSPAPTGKAPAYPVYLGAAGNDIGPMTESIDVEHSWEYQKLGAPADLRAWRREKISSPSDRAALLARKIADGEVVGLYQGRSELGPRALGHRSVLFRADSTAIAERVSRGIKDRSAYRPYALALLEEDAAELLDLGGLDPRARPLHWMQLALPIQESQRARLAAGAHIDGTTRPQLVGPGDDPFFHALLLELKRRTGLGALINTSMNESGYPMVGAAEEALLFFARTSLDALMVDDFLVWRE